MSDTFQNEWGQVVLGGTFVGGGTDTGVNLHLTGTLQVDGASTLVGVSNSSTDTATAQVASGLTGAVSATRYVGGTATVAPTAGTFAVGDFVVSQNGSAWVCTVAGSPGTWVSLQSVLLAPKASPTFTGTVTVPAAAAVGSATKLADLSSYLTITSGSLPTLGAWASGTAQQNPVTRQITVVLAISDDATNNAATVAVAISPDNSTFTTVATWSVAAALDNLGAETDIVPITLPNAWWIKLTISAHAAVAQSYYY